MVFYPLDFAAPLPYGLLPFGFIGSPFTLWVATFWNYRQSPYLMACYPFGCLGSPPTLWFVTLWISRQSPYLMVCYPLDF